MNVDGVFNATMQNEKLHVTVDDPLVVTPRLIAAMVLAGVQILSVTPERASLESIYLHLVGEGHHE